MTRRTFAAAAAGTGAGAFLGILALALAAGQVATSGLGVTESGAPTFAVTQAAMYTYLLLAGAVGGSLVALVGRFAGANDESRHGPNPVALLGAVSGAVLAFATARTAVGIGGDITSGIVSITVFRAAILSLVIGATTGLTVAIAAERLGRPAALGVDGEAAPASAGAFLRHAAVSAGLPIAGLLAAVASAFGISRILLGADRSIALAVFGGLAAALLAGAAFVASRAPRRRSRD